MLSQFGYFSFVRKFISNNSAAVKTLISLSNSESVEKIYENFVFTLDEKCKKKEFNSSSLMIALIACSYIISEFHDGYFIVKGSG